MGEALTGISTAELYAISKTPDRMLEGIRVRFPGCVILLSMDRRQVTGDI